MNPDCAEMSPGRRRFLSRLSLGFAGIGAALVGAPVVGFLVAPLFRSVANRWRPVGKVSSFQAGQTVEVTYEDASPLAWAGVTSKTGAWLRHEGGDQFTAFAINCSHLGCPVRWLPEADLFMCPCHGGVYYKNGNVAAGPPPRPLTKYPVRVREGLVEILTRPTPIT